jgi:putative oxidoreductase
MNLNTLFATDKNNWAALIIRLTVGIVLFPHGAQKLFGWFGGYGFTGTMGFLTGMQHLPWIIGFLVIMIESVGCLALIAGFATRLLSIAVLVEFIGIIFAVHIKFGYFMNWAGVTGAGEGVEYHLLVLGLCLAAIISGGGKWSVDSLLTKNIN